ncbi:MAG: AraC family transcriptional regulator [Gammaproteobacteria bacterium]|nr:AraC family transcriptional regulator [Gammaproteobacteria bacterium]MBU1600972.1 AraC family transcriptional regulator [Gammaproteobacteria bacterium]MBU2434331.1 AraC family transcriptional regulator [Gammaproteobacteria bacterium]MBU2450735.1 AraC family transcriptional regulator [Gammaproteobacteria bacterium]
MRSGTFDEFKALALAEGFDEVLERTWPADAVLDAHNHPFALKARDVTHAERYGNAGATYWVARRN